MFDITFGLVSSGLFRNGSNAAGFCGQPMIWERLMMIIMIMVC